MANRVKEDEKNERTIRSLLKLPENRRCINCNSLGPQYICTNFWTFVCTTCSGIHREFTHRVKSVSMAKFTSQEVAALQGGGNARAKESLFKDWDPQRHSFPNSSNIERLRDFIKHVYVDRRYTGEKAFEKPPKVKTGEESYENRRSESYQGGSRSPPYEDTYERRYSDRPSPGGRSDDSNSRYDERRSPGYDRENQQYGDYGKSPVRPEIVNDWRRDDRFGNGNRKTSDDDSRSGGRSPDYQKDKDISSPPIVRPVREILGDNVMPLRISEPPKANVSRAADGFANTLRTSSSSSFGSADGNPVEPKRETLGSLIDFDADPEPPVKAAVQQPQQTSTAQSTAQPTSTSSDDNWASFDVATEANISHFPSNVNNLESLFSQLSVPASIPGGVPSALPVSSPSPIPISGAPQAVPVVTSISPINGVNSFDKVHDAGQWPIMQHQHSLFPAAGFQSSGQQFVAPTTQPWNPSFAPNAQGTSSNTHAQAPQIVSKIALEGNSSFLAQPSPMEAKSSGRTALPEDLFAATYPSNYAPVPGWQSGPPGGMGFAMQYNTAAPILTYPQPSKLTNPFDLTNELPPLQAPSFPSMTALHGALPNMPPPTGLLRTSSLGTPLPAWIPLPPQSSSYASALPPLAPSFASALPPRAYTGQQIPNNMPPSWHQGVGGLGNEGAAFGSTNSNQLLPGGYSAPATPTSFPSVGGNPFG